MPRKGKHPSHFGDDDYDDGYDDDYYDYDDYQDDHAASSRIPEPPREFSQQSSSGQSTNLWRCSVCTFDNSEELQACDICGVARHVALSDPAPDARPKKLCDVAGASVLAKSLFTPLPPGKLKKSKVIQQLRHKFSGTDLSETNPIFNGSFQELRSRSVEIGLVHEPTGEFSMDLVQIKQLVDECLSDGIVLKAVVGICTVPFKFDTPSPDDLVVAGKRSAIKTTVKTSSTDVSTSNENSLVQPFDKEVAPVIVKPTPKKRLVPGPAKDPLRNDQNGVVIQSLPKDDEQLSEGLKNLDLIKAGKDQGQQFSKGKGPPLDTYCSESWMIDDLKHESKQFLHLAIVGHVDAGKSTLMGRILHILGRVSQKEMHKYEKEAKEKGKGSFSYAWVLDESAEERARGVTMTVAVAHFETPKFRVILLDSPGHKDFVPNMISGASQADAAILLVDASVGAFEAGMDGDGQGGGQTKEHTQLVRSFGVEQIIVAVNKMDAIEYSQDRFNSIKASLRPFLRHCGFKDSGIKWVPVSAMQNQNLVTQPTDVNLGTWWSGPCLLEAIDTFEAPLRNISKPFRMPIAEIVKSRSLGQAAVSGKLEGGAIKTGTKVLVMPVGILATVKGIEQDGEPCASARAGDSVEVGLQGVEPSFLLQGGVLCHPDYPVPAASCLEVKILVLDTSSPLLRGSQVIFHCHHLKEPAKITQLVSLLDPKSGAVMKKKPRCLLANQSAVIELVPERGVCVEEYSRYKALGRVSLRDGGKTIAVGIVMRVLDYE